MQRPGAVKASVSTRVSHKTSLTGYIPWLHHWNATYTCHPNNLVTALPHYGHFECTLQGRYSGEAQDIRRAPTLLPAIT